MMMRLFLSLLAGCIVTLTIIHFMNTEEKEIPEYSIIIIEGCEYIEIKKGYGGGRTYALTHKGNCKNHGNNIQP